MAYLDYVGLAYFKSLLDENYLRTNYEGDTVIEGNVTFTKPVDASVKNDWLGQQIDKTYLKDVIPDPEGSGALALILGDGSVSHLVTDTTVTQVRSNANELYPILLCYDASAEEDQIAKKVWYGNGVRINPRYGYLYSQKMLTLHPTYNRAVAPTSRVEWTNDFRDSVLNPVGQIFEYIDPVSQGGEHRMELRLYGNPNVAGINTPNVNYETNTVSLGVSATRGDALTFFGYAPSTPIYLEDGSTMRKSLVRGDQYGKDIITRDWLNLNGSITGLVHTYMDETIDGYKTFLKTVTIDSGDDNNKAGLNVQGDVNIDSGDANKPSDLYVQGDSHIHGNEDIDGNLNVDGTSDQHGNVHMYHNLDVDGNANTDGNQTVGGNITVGGAINKVSGNTAQEYVTYVTNQADTRKDIAAGLVDTSRGMGYDSSTGKIYIKASTDDGLKFNSNGTLAVDFSQMPTDKFEALLKGLKMQIPLTSNLSVHVDASSDGDSIVDGRGTASKPFKTIQACVTWAVGNYSLGKYSITILVHPGTYDESVSLPSYNSGSGHFILKAYDLANPPTIRRNNVAGSACISCDGRWDLVRINLVHYPVDGGEGRNYYPYCLSVNDGAQCLVYGCNFTMRYNGASTNRVRMFVVSCSSGILQFMPFDTYKTTFNYHLGSGEYLYVIEAETTGKIYFRGTFNDSPVIRMDCQGDCTSFANASSQSLIMKAGSGDRFMYFVVASGQSCTGQKYSVSSGSGISQPDGGFPGSTDGVIVNDGTYSWYK